MPTLEQTSSLGFVTPEVFGAVGDGTADDAIPLQRAIDYAIANSKTLELLARTYATSVKLTISGAIKIRGRDCYTSLIKATTAVTSVLEIGNVSAVFRFENFGVTSTGTAVNGISFIGSAAIFQGSAFIGIRVDGYTGKGVSCVAPMYASLWQQFIASGGQYGFHLVSNAAMNGSVLQSWRISNTTVQAVHIENTGVSLSTVAFYSLTIEGNDGMALYLNKIRAEVILPWLEGNGDVTGDPDIQLESSGNIITIAFIYNLAKSTNGAAQDGTIVKFLSTHCRVAMVGGNLSASHKIDGNNFSTGCEVLLLNALPDIVNYLGTIKRLGATAVTTIDLTSPTLSVTDSGKSFSNEGATARIDYTLPAASSGLEFEFCVMDTDGIRVIAVGNDTITNDAATSAAAGRIDSTTLYSTILLRAINSTRWVVIKGNNRAAWTVT